MIRSESAKHRTKREAMGIAYPTTILPKQRPPGYWKSRTFGGAKKISRKATPEKRADEWFSKAMRQERPYCEDDREGHGTGTIKHPQFSLCKGRCELMHGHERWHRATRYDERNVWVGCQGAHFWYGMHPLLWDDFMRRKQGDLYDEIRLKALNVGGTVRHDYAAIVEEYKARYFAAGGER